MIKNKHLPNKFEPIPSPELSYVLGVLKGDGTVYKTVRKYKNRSNFISYQICLSVRDKSFAITFAKALSKVFDRKVKVIKCDEKNNRGIFYKVFLASRIFYDWYNSNEVFDIALNFPNEFIRGVYDSEGSFSYIRSVSNKNEYYYHTIRFVSSNKELLLIIQRILKDKFSIISKFRERGIPKPSLINNKRIIWKKDVYRLGIFNKFGVNLFFEEIGTCIPSKDIKYVKTLIEKIYIEL